MNHLPTEEQDKGFQEGRAVAQYLENHVCPHIPKIDGHGCPDCIADAVNAVHQAEAWRRTLENPEVLKFWGPSV